MPPPQQIGRYRLVRPVGAGAFAMVWLAHDDSLDAPVAVKVMAENWAYRMDLRERFLSEARLLRKAASSRLVQVFDVGELPDERPYFVMEYADGGTLDDLLALGRPSLGEALRLTAEAARGVAALHEAGVVHRDIKPSNVLISGVREGQGRVLVADLGLAKALAQASGLTMAAGSAGYMAPEQGRPDGGIDVRADVYGLGALLYHLVTGSVPGPPGKVVRPGRLRPGLPAAVERAVLRALQPDRRKRWPSASRFADELDALAARSVDHVEGARRGRPARTMVAALCAAALVAAGTGLAASRSGAPSAAAPTAERAVEQTVAPTVVSDATERIRVRVPAGWGRELVRGGWSPRALGLPDAHEPALLVAADTGSWQDLGSGVDGVFVGLSEHGDLTARVDAVRHGGCRYRGSRAYGAATSPGWRGRVRHWTACGPRGGSVDEISLTRAGASQPQVYVQIRQAGGPDLTDDVLGGLRITA
ncbi:serine/threonine-protein kinase [Actinacidiphila sp. bgisy167]|uniref:serine/threonine-protein kinase n=1 Tax=Actinacidiphila sp. bgisy167 TaxID=3413797 RepID=UPI003D757057